MTRYYINTDQARAGASELHAIARAVADVAFEAQRAVGGISPPPVELAHLGFKIRAIRSRIDRDVALRLHDDADLLSTSAHQNEQLQADMSWTPFNSSEATPEAVLRTLLEKLGLSEALISAVLTGDLSKLPSDMGETLRRDIERIANNVKTLSADGLDLGDLLFIVGSAQLLAANALGLGAGYLLSGDAKSKLGVGEQVLRTSGNAARSLRYLWPRANDDIATALSNPGDPIAVRRAMITTIRTIGTALEAIPIPQVQGYGRNWIGTAANMDDAARSLATGDWLASIHSTGAALANGIGMIPAPQAQAFTALANGLDAASAALADGDLNRLREALGTVVTQSLSLSQ